MSPETNKHIFKYLPMRDSRQCEGEEQWNGEMRPMKKNGSLGAPMIYGLQST